MNSLTVWTIFFLIFNQANETSGLRCSLVRGCSCTYTVINGSKHVKLKCNNRKLNNIPTFPQTNDTIDELHLEGNRISSIPDNAFKNIPNTRAIWLNNNAITSQNIHLNAFKGLELSLKKLNLGYNNIKEFPSAALNLLTSLEEADLKNNMMVHLQDDTLSGLSSIKTMDLSYNRHLTIGKNTFNNLTQLSVLRLSHNLLSEILPGTFSEQQTSLRELDMSFNMLNDLESAAFENATMLNKLLLSNNKISAIPQRAFSKQHHLETLDLSENQIKAQAIDIQAFNGIKHYLDILNLTNNQLDTFPNQQMFNFVNLKELYLAGNNISFLPDCKGHCTFMNTSPNVFDISHNNLREVPDTLFENTDKNIVTVDLSYNMLQEFPTGALIRLTRIKTLKINYNQIKSLPSNMIRNNVWLRDLQLEGNLIRDIDVTAFAGRHNRLKFLNLNNNELIQIPVNPQISRLAVMKLNNNKIQNIYGGTFSSMRTLLQLYLEHNRIYRIETGAFSGIESKLARLYLGNNSLSYEDLLPIKDLTNLRYINLAYNSIQNLGDNTFNGMTRLATLKLNNNELANIAKNSFAGLENSLIVLSLQQNNLTGLDHCTFTNFTKLKALSLGGNPIECNCSMHWVNAIRVYGVCALPANRKGWSVIRFRRLKICDNDALKSCSPLPTTTLPTTLPTTTVAIKTEASTTAHSTAIPIVSATTQKMSSTATRTNTTESNYGNTTVVATLNTTTIQTTQQSAAASPSTPDVVTTTTEPTTITSQTTTTQPTILSTATVSLANATTSAEQTTRTNATVHVANKTTTGTTPTSVTSASSTTSSSTTMVKPITIVTIGKPTKGTQTTKKSVVTTKTTSHTKGVTAKSSDDDDGIDNEMTIIIITVSICGTIILVFLIIGIVFYCYKKRQAELQERLAQSESMYVINKTFNGHDDHSSGISIGTAGSLAYEPLDEQKYTYADPSQLEVDLPPPVKSHPNAYRGDSIFDDLDGQKYERPITTHERAAAMIPVRGLDTPLPLTPLEKAKLDKEHMDMFSTQLARNDNKDSLRMEENLFYHTLEPSMDQKQDTSAADNFKEIDLLDSDNKNIYDDKTRRASADSIDIKYGSEDYLQIV